MSLIRSAAFLGVLLAMPGRPQPPTDLPTIPAERSAEAYAVYSTLIDHPKLSHRDTAEKYLIENSTGPKMSAMPGKCVHPPPAYRVSFEEILAEFEAHKSDSSRLERKFTLSKPYEILDPLEAKQFQDMSMNSTSPGASRDDVDKFRGGTDLIQLGNIYFNRNRKLAMVHTGAWCGGLCGLWSWRFLEKDDNGNWRELKWDTCITVANDRSRPGFSAGSPQNSIGAHRRLF